MSLFKKLAVNTFALSFGAIVALPSQTQAAPIIVQASDQPSLALAGTGMTYRPNGANSFVASVETDGFLFCANVGQDGTSATTITLSPKHTTWNLGSGADIRSLTYGNNGTVIRINQNANGTPILSSLACYVRGADGSLFSPFAGGVFYHGFEADYPGDASTNNVRGWLYGDDGSGTYRAPIMSTQIYAQGQQNIYAYAFELHGDAAASVFAGGVVTEVPLRMRGEFDTAFFGSKPSGTWCALDVAPTRPLNLATACAAPQQLPADGVLDFPNFLLDPGLNGLSRTKYIVVRRVLTVAPSALPTDRPIVAAAVFVDPSVDEAYTGDNVLFGFAPGVTQAPASLPVNKKH